MCKEEVQAWLGRSREVAANLDQNPQQQSHYGDAMPTLLASLSNMYALRSGRLFTSRVAWSCLVGDAVWVTVGDGDGDGVEIS